MISPKTSPDAFLKELHLDNLSGKERQDVLESLEKRLNDVLLETVLAYLSDEQFEDFKKAMASDNPEEEIAIVTAQVPGLADIIENRLLEEYRIIKSVMA